MVGGQHQATGVVDDAGADAAACLEPAEQIDLDDGRAERDGDVGRAVHLARCQRRGRGVVAAAEPEPGGDGTNQQRSEDATHRPVAGVAPLGLGLERWRSRNGRSVGELNRGGLFGVDGEAEGGNLVRQRR